MLYPHYKTEALVLKKMPFGEADFLVRVLTREFGKMDILAKGARKTNSKLNSHLDILNYIRIMFIKNGSRFSTVTDAETLERFDDWFLGAESLGVAGRVIKTLDVFLMPESEDEKLFLMVLDFFKQEPSRNSEDNAVHFIKTVFAHEGYGDTLPQHLSDSIMKLWPYAFR